MGDVLILWRVARIYYSVIDFFRKQLSSIGYLLCDISVMADIRFCAPVTWDSIGDREPDGDGFQTSGSGTTKRSEGNSPSGASGADQTLRPVSMSLMLGALGLRLIVKEDAEALDRAIRRLEASLAAGLRFARIDFEECPSTAWKVL
jgi:hypothetical protein